MARTLWRNVIMKIILNINIRSVLIFDRNLVGGDEVVRSSSFSTCRHDCGRDYRSAVLHGDHHCDVVWWLMWSELGGAARDMVWWLELGRAARDVVDVVWWSELYGAAQDVVDVARLAARAVHWLARRGSPTVWPAHLMARRG